jgi:hypothetical protein
MVGVQERPVSELSKLHFVHVILALFDSGKVVGEGNLNCNSALTTVKALINNTQVAPKCCSSRTSYKQV